MQFPTTLIIMPSSYTPLPTSPVGFEKNGNLLAPESNYTLDNNCQHNTKGVMPSIEIANVTTDVCTEITPPRLSWDTTRNETQGSVQLWKLLKTYSRNECKCFIYLLYYNRLIVIITCVYSII